MHTNKIGFVSSQKVVPTIFVRFANRMASLFSLSITSRSLHHLLHYDWSVGTQHKQYGDDRHERLVKVVSVVQPHEGCRGDVLHL